MVRLLETEHPFLKLIRNKIDLTDFFFPKCLHNVDGLSIEGLNLLRGIRHKLASNPKLTSNRKYVAVVKDIRLANVISRIGKNSIAYFSARRAGIERIGDLTERQLNSLEHFTDNNLTGTIKLVHRLAGDQNFINSGEHHNSHFAQDKVVDLRKLSSKSL